jgi:FkbM family methyltransferase
MKRAIMGYWGLCKKYGLIKSLRFLRAYYYGKSKEKNIDLGKEHIIDVNGYKLKSIPNDRGISLELLKFNTHEPLSTKLISQELKKGMVCLDLGGNIGYYTLLESKIVGEEGKIISVEPSPQNYHYLKENLDMQNISNVETYNFACGDIDGEINFLISKNSNTCRTISDDEPIPKNQKIIKVPIKKLDTFLEENPLPRIDFLRTDVEGYEMQVFEGAKKTIQKHKPMIQIEVHPDYLGKSKTKRFLQFLENENYDVKYFIRGEFDTPMVGTMNDVKKYSLKKLFQMLDDNTLPGNFLLFLENKFNDSN